MARKKQGRKLRTELRKKHQQRTRVSDLTRQFEAHGFEDDESHRSERISGKGELTRKRTVVGEAADSSEHGLEVLPEIDPDTCRLGRVLSVHGLKSDVLTDDGHHYQCAVRGLLKDLSTDQRHVVAAGDTVWIRPENDNEGFIERIEPRHGVLSRTSRQRQHVIVANVDLLVIVASAAAPVLKPHLIDRFLVSAESARIQPVVCINKVDLVDAADLQPLIGVYGQMGYPVVLTSASSGQGIDRLARFLHGGASVLAGQSGVGKSSLLNAVDPQLQLRVGEVSLDTQKGRHTTTTARLLPLSGGGFVVDTPGIRQFELWNIIAEEVAGYFRDLRPFESLCRFPDCTHQHEADCAVKDAVADGKLDVRRYESYCQMHAGD